VFLIAYFVLQLRFRLPEEGIHQAHALEVFNATAQKVMKDAISYARIQANNAYYKEVLGQKMNKKLNYSHIYLIEEQYRHVNVLSCFIFNVRYWFSHDTLPPSLFRRLFRGSSTASRFT
jgi:hypothetical protein